ncbi:MAG: GGDEF domain-containing protein, partial [Candidatus Aminicenantes bacterium]|nr:GGDEF domain-containing protein [Candidatus Aminicenantes bacterium]
MNKRVSKAKLQALLYTDELTRLFNLRYLREQIPPYLEKAKKQKDRVAFIFFDMDDFKNINDSYGHLAGDRVLVHVTKIIGQIRKEEGIAIRYAGDEFLLIIPKLNKREAKRLGEEIQKSMASSPIKINGKNITCDCSIGISQFPIDGNDWKTLFAKADEALYVAKEQGKARVIVVPDSGRLLTPSKLNSILETPYIVGRDNVIRFLEKHLSNQGNTKNFPIILGEEGSGKTRVLKLAGEFSRKKLQFTLTTKGYSFW